MDELEKRIFERCLVRGEFQFASGEAANNKFDTDYLKDTPEGDQVADLLAKKVKQFNPQLLGALMNGGEYWAENVSNRVKIPYIRIMKPDSSAGETGFSIHLDDRWYASRNPESRLLLIDDVGTKLSTLRKALVLPYVGRNAMALVGILRRQPEDLYAPDPIKTAWLFERDIPAMLPDDSLLWPEASGDQVS